MLPPANGSASPGGLATARCRPAAGQDVLPVFFSETVSWPVGSPGASTRPGAVDCATTALTVEARTCHQLDRRPSLDAGQEWAL